MSKISVFVDINRLINASSFEVVKFAQKLVDFEALPVGYDNVADFFKKNSERLASAHFVWMLAEAALLGRLEEAKREFPKAYSDSSKLLGVMQAPILKAIEMKNSEMVKIIQIKQISYIVAVGTFLFGLLIGIYFG